MSDPSQTIIQAKLAVLQEKKWTIAALADRLGQSVSTLEKWKNGERNPANEKAVLEMLGRLMKRKPPKQRRYVKGSRRKVDNG